MSEGGTVGTAPSPRLTGRRLRRATVFVAATIVILIALAFVAIGVAEPHSSGNSNAQVETRFGKAMSLCLQYSVGLPGTEDHYDKALEIWERNRAMVLRASRVCSSDEEAPCPSFIRALRKMLGDFRNGHTWARLDGDFVSPRLLVEKIENRAVITAVPSDSDAERGGLRCSMEVVAVDGRPTAEVLLSVPSWALGYKSERTRQYRAHMKLLWGPAGVPVTVTARDRSGRDHVVRLERPETQHSPEPEDGPSDFDTADLDGGIGLLWIGGFQGEDLPERLREALAKTHHRQGIILDLRENHGGRENLMLRFLGMFVDETTVIGDNCERETLDDDSNGLRCEPARILPAAPVITERLAVLIGPRTISAGEIAAHSLCASGRAICFGQASAGETDTVETQKLPGGEVGVAVGWFRPNGPDLLDGLGVQPQVEIRESIADIDEGKDPTLDAATRWLLGERAVAAMSTPP